MTRKGSALAFSLLVLAFGSFFPSAAFAEELTCPPDIATGVVTEKVIVPVGETCQITDSEIRGNIELVFADSTLMITGGTLLGNIECENGGTVVISGVIVRGNIDGCIVL